MGIEADRVEMVHMSSAEGQRFAQFATEFTEKIRRLGPSPVKGKAPLDKPNHNMVLSGQST